MPEGKTVGIVGESGCGKSVTSLSLMQLVQRPQGQITDGAIRFNSGEKIYDIAKTPMKEMYNIRGNKISMIFQEPMTSLNPVFKIGTQIEEVIELHSFELFADHDEFNQEDGEKKNFSESERKAIKKHTIEMLDMVGIANSKGVYDMYPHELSGGMRQKSNDSYGFGM